MALEPRWQREYGSKTDHIFVEDAYWRVAICRCALVPPGARMVSGGGAKRCLRCHAKLPSLED